MTMQQRKRRRVDTKQQQQQDDDDLSASDKNDNNAMLHHHHHHHHQQQQQKRRQNDSNRTRDIISNPKTTTKIKTPYKLLLLCTVCIAVATTTAAAVVAEAVMEPLHSISSSNDDDDDDLVVDNYRNKENIPSSPATAEEEETPNEQETKEGLIVIATVDGTLAGLSKSSGETIWKMRSPSSSSYSNNNKNKKEECHDYNMRPPPTTANPHPKNEKKKQGLLEEEEEADKLLAPLVSTTTTTKSSSFHSLGADWRTAAVPSVDGRVYLTTNHKKNGGSTTTDSSSTTTTTTTSDDTGGGDVTATAMVRDLVHKSPFVDNHGRRFYVGSRSASAAALDVDTGEILRLVGGDGPYNSHHRRRRSQQKHSQKQKDENEHNIADDDDNDDDTPPKEGQASSSSLENRNVVWVGRVDYTVSIYDTRTGDLDVQFSTSEVLSVNDMVQGGGSGTSGHMIGAAAGGAGGLNGFPPEMSLELFHGNGAGGAGFHNQLMLNKGFGSRDKNSASSSSSSSTATPSALSSSGLIATPNGNIAFLNPATNTIDWVANEAFDTPVAFAIDSDTGMSLGVDIIPDVPLPNKFQSKEYMSRELIRRFREIDDGNSGGGGSDDLDNEYNNRGGGGVDETIVGALKSGQLFAMPLGGTRNSNNAAGTQGGGGRHASSSSSSSAATKRNPMLPSLPQPPLLKQTTSLSSSKETGGVGGTGTATASDRIINNKQSKPNYLFDPEKKYTVDKTKEVDEKMKQQQRQQDLAEQKQQYEDYIATIPNYYDQNQHHYHQRQKRGKFHTFFMIMTSWIPPAVALAFVVSFELGRRERLRAENITFLDDNTSSSLTSSSAVLSSPLKIKKRNEGIGENSSFALKKSDGDNNNDTNKEGTDNNNHLISDDNNNDTLSIRNVGVIQVTNEVLGYGGHGTVVYRGKLDGRNVAVKRMLKTYHASAEREISLLIESDGHPNVVRYFLKEVRGDFVYLALELCDMSLHDLIVTLCKRKNSSSLVVGGGNNGGNGWIPVAKHNDEYHDADDVDSSITTSAGISSATKNTLLQITSGVRHLHSLRIVHRDLKPQNILLAQQRSGVSGGNNNSLTVNGRLKTENLSSNNGELGNNDEGNTSTGNDEEDAVYSAFEQNSFIPKISDMGLGKQLAGQSSFGMSTLGNSSAYGGPGGAGASAERTDVVGAGPGSVGWQAPEVMSLRFSPESARVSLMTRTQSTFQSDASSSSIAGDGNSNGREDSMVEASPIIEGTALNNMRTSRSVDIFSLGCIFYCVCVPGSHPFGEWYEREANIMKNNPSIEALMKISADASDLVKSMIERDPKKRPTAAQVCDHPFFWSATKRIAFLCELSDRLEADSPSTAATKAIPTKSTTTTVEDDSSTRTNNIDALIIERNAAQVVGTSWDKDLDPDLLSNVSRFRTYDPCSVRDCLRIIRNKYHHYDELPAGVKQRIGPHPDDLLRYFESKFPNLVMHCYNVCRDIVMSADDPFAAKYGITPRRPLQATPKTAKHDDSNRIDNATPSLVGMGKTKNGILSLSEKKVGSSLSHHPSVELEVKEVDGDKNYYEIIKPQDSSISSSSNNTSRPASLLSNDLSTSIATATTSSPLLRSDVSSDEPADKAKPTKPLSSSVEPSLQEPKNDLLENTSADLVIWEGSNAAKTLQCRGWMRSEDEWVRRSDVTVRKRDANITRCATDPKFRTRLCNHWDSSGGTFCPMRKKNKCVFAHGPVELRVKEGKRNRWGKLVDKNGNNSNPFHSGGEDTYGAARSIESQRKEEGKWNTKSPQGKGRSKGKQSSGRKR